MKLSDWADKQGIAYLTAYRWFKAGKLPVKAYQSESGTIIVQDDSETLSETSMNPNDTSSGIISLFLKKTVEFAKNNSSIEDFAAYILSNFNLKMNTVSEGPKYSKNKPKSEDIQNHFKQFIPKVEKPKPNMFVAEKDSIDDLIARSDQLTKQELVAEINNIGETSALYLSDSLSLNDVPEVKDLYKDLSVALNVSSSTPLATNSVTTYGALGHEGVVVRSNLTPQNYTTPDSRSFSPATITISAASASVDVDSFGFDQPTGSSLISFDGTGSTGSFKPTSKELEMVKSLAAVQPKRRGRKAKGTK